MLRAAIVAGLLAGLAGGAIGYHMGRRRADIEPPIVTLLSCPETPECAPAATTTAQTPSPSARASTSGPRRTLPKLSGAEAPRERLLAFIRERSDGFRTCAGRRSERLHLTLRVDVDRDGLVRRVESVERDPSTREAVACIAARMNAWKLPDWAPVDTSLLVALVL